MIGMDMAGRMTRFHAVHVYVSKHINPPVQQKHSTNPTKQSPTFPHGVAAKMPKHHREHSNKV